MERAKSRDELLFQQQGYRHQSRIEATLSSASSPAQVTYSPSPATAHPRGAKQLSQLATQVFNVAGKRAAKSPLQQHGQTPPPPPPKAEPQAQAQLRPPPVVAGTENRSSIIPISPGISSAVSFMRMGEEQRDQERERERVVLQREQEQEAVRQELGKDKGAEKVGDVEKTDSADKAELKDSWRKSDSTIGHHTIRPGVASGSRPSRPVSMAESLQSNHTIVPVNKRLSALITDADFGMPEEDDSEKHVEDESKYITTEDNTTPTLKAKQASPAPSLKAKNRRSMSLNITSPFLQPKLPPAPASASAAELKHPSHSISEGMTPPSMSPSLSRETPTLTRTTANATGFIGPSSPGSQSTGNNIRGQLAAWTATTTTTSYAASSSSHSSHSHTGHGPAHTNNPYTTFPPPPEPYSRQERRLPALPPQRTQPTHAGPSFRQTAISMTNSLAPAAGLAKRAVEKMGRAWGGLSSSSSASGYSSSSSANTGTAPSSYSYDHHHNNNYHPHGLELGRTVSNQSSSGGLHHIERDKKGKLRRTPNAPSQSSSFTGSSSASISDADAFSAPSGPVLGKRLRGPLRMKHGGVGGNGGVVFGRDLKIVVRETGVGVGKPKAWGGRWRNWDGEEGGGEEGVEETGEDALRAKRGSVRRGQLKALEERKLPALVVRCAQHLLIWGIQEEGLFRYVCMLFVVACIVNGVFF
jgi:hypothetical protein